MNNELTQARLSDLDCCHIWQMLEWKHRSWSESYYSDYIQHQYATQNIIVILYALHKHMHVLPTCRVLPS